MTRDELIEAGARALYEVSRDWDKITPRDMATAMLGVVEPIIREDERARMAHLARVVPGGGIRDVRGEVKALYEADDAWTSHAYNAAIDDVLALLGGSDD